MINKIINEEVEKQQRTQTEEEDVTNEPDELEEPEKVQLNLPYGGEKGTTADEKARAEYRKKP